MVIKSTLCIIMAVNAEDQDKKDRFVSYKQLKFLLWKNISLHTSVYSGWDKMKKIEGTKTIAVLLVSLLIPYPKFRKIQWPKEPMKGEWKELFIQYLIYTLWPN